MNSSKYQLPDLLIADLYKQSLVLIPGEEPLSQNQPALNPIALRERYLGNNQKKITILVNEKEAAYLEDDALQFLSAILGACKLNLGDVAIVNYEKDPLGYSELKEKLSPRFMLLFDVTAKQLQLPFTVPFYQVQQYDSCQFLLAPSLIRMLGDSQEAKLEKSKLWLSLKKMFGV
jgi:hypothetical protein